MRYNSNTCTVDMSVRSLCALVAKSGDLDASRFTNVEALISGTKVHKKLQKEAGGFYNAEVTLTNTTLCDGLYFTVSGRADGIIRTPNEAIVDEIKCVRPYEFYLPPKEAHMAQLKCYSYFLAVRDGLDKVKARMTYYNTETEKIKYFNYTFDISDLKAYYFSLLEAAAPFARIMIERELDVLPEAARAVFPYTELREGQEMMIRECYGAIKRGQKLFVEAPTGTGKTISSLFPTVRALGEKKVDKIFYLTAKASTRREAYAGTSKLFSAGVKLRAVVLNSKESACMCEARQGSWHNLCNPDDCPYAKGYYDKVNSALIELLTGGNGYPAKTVAAVAKKYGICPYELSLDLSEYCDVIICDYNYAFDPSVYLRRYFGDDGKREKYVFLIDEAHNLADRARDMYSAVLKMLDFGAVRQLLGESDGELDCAFGEILRELLGLRELCSDSIVKDADGVERGFYLSREPLAELCEKLDIFKKKCDAWMRRSKEHEAYDAVYSLCSSVRKYLCINEYFDKGFLCYVELGGGDITVKTYCLDPSAVMKTLLNRATSSVMFSATLTPAEYFCDVLGCAEDGVSVTLPSPFDSEKLCVAVADYVSTRYDDRAANTARYVSIIAASVSARAGNYIVYFPSYECLDKVYRAFVTKYPSVETVVQKRNMKLYEKEEFLSGFKADTGKLRIGFCVLGGAFSEGVDLPGTRLIGTVIFGTGLPGLSNERNIIRDYFDEDTGTGYDYAYTYPGMNNVLQAAGRVIRTENDMGIVVLVDDRYATPQYTRLFPQSWKHVQYARNARSLAEIATRFWKNKG
ncbi:MAG: ATP-dependent DNA helicase [Ruminococcaceae bacterium]|nr:ATP-dependent DNA helicase [Oscillospiraceae bacterium]